jgi:hypothetical protein
MTVTFHQNIFTQGSTNPTVNSNSQNNTNNQFIKPFTVNIKEEKQLSNSAQTPFLDCTKTNSQFVPLPFCIHFLTVN